MEREMPRLAEDLREERAWEADGVTVLTARIVLPQLSGRSRRARRFNGYYRRFCRAYLAYCEQVLLPEAAARCAAALAVSAPWRHTHAALDYTVSLRRGALLSLVTDAREEGGAAPGFVIRRADTWDLAAALPVPLGEFFPGHARALLLRCAREETGRRIGQGDASFRADWRAALRRALNPRNYYLCEEGLRWFYPAGAVAAAERGIVSFLLPYDAARGPFPPDFFG